MHTHLSLTDEKFTVWRKLSEAVSLRQNKTAKCYLFLFYHVKAAGKSVNFLPKIKIKRLICKQKT